jgi:hypothetical protein
MRLSVFGGVGLGPLTRAVAVMLDVGLAVVTTTAVPTPGTALLPVGELGLPARKFSMVNQQQTNKMIWKQLLLPAIYRANKKNRRLRSTQLSDTLTYIVSNSTDFLYVIFVKHNQ